MSGRASSGSSLPGSEQNEPSVPVRSGGNDGFEDSLELRKLGIFIIRATFSTVDTSGVVSSSTGTAGRTFGPDTMSTTTEPIRPTSRRRFLALAGLAGAGALAGCTGGGSPADGPGEANDTGDGPTENGDAGGDSLDCGGFDGPAVTFDPGDDPWTFLFDYPETWEPWESEFDGDFEGAVSADIGHAATATDEEYRVNIHVDQVTIPRDADFVAEWLESGNFEVDGTIEYDGRTLDVATGHVTSEDLVWRVALPAPGNATGEYHQVSMRAWMLEEHLGCDDAIFDVARGAFESIRPNPEYAG